MIQATTEAVSSPPFLNLPSTLPPTFQHSAIERPKALQSRHYHEEHGLERGDDYFWMRNKQDPRFIDYLTQWNAYTQNYLLPLKPLSSVLQLEMGNRVEPEYETIPYKIGSFFYYKKYIRDAEFPLYCRKSENGVSILFNPNSLSSSHSYLDIKEFLPSPDGQYALITLDTTGSHFGITKIYDLNSKQFSSTIIPNTNGNFAWNIHSNGFWYIELNEVKRFSKLKYHKMGTDLACDMLIYEEKNEYFDLQITQDKLKKNLVVYSASKDISKAMLAPLHAPQELSQFTPPHENSLYGVTPSGHGTYVTSNQGKGNFGLFRRKEPGNQWETIIAATPHSSIESIEVFERFIVAKKRTQGILSLDVIDPITLKSYPIRLPHEMCEIDFYYNTNYYSTSLWFTLSSPILPLSVYEWNMETLQQKLLWQDKAGGFNTAAFTSERISAYNHGVEVPISLFYKKGLQKSQETPLLLYVYGAYGMNSDPSFCPAKPSLLQRDCIYAIAHVRGGGDLGHSWYEAGKMGNKMNTFTDLIACAETLINKGYTSPNKLALEGGSAGGLAVGAVINMRPDLFKTCLVYVPFVDAVTTMFDMTIPLTPQERKEWGNPEIKQEYDWLKLYSPYDGIKDQKYPSLFVMSGYNDEQVGPWEPAKWVAKLVDFKTDDNPILLSVNMKAGHSGPSGRYERFEEVSTSIAFLFEQLGVKEEG